MLDCRSGRVPTVDFIRLIPPFFSLFFSLTHSFLFKISYSFSFSPFPPFYLLIHLSISFLWLFFSRLTPLVRVPKQAQSSSRVNNHYPSFEKSRLRDNSTTRRVHARSTQKPSVNESVIWTPVITTRDTPPKVTHHSSVLGTRVHFGARFERPRGKLSRLRDLACSLALRDTAMSDPVRPTLLYFLAIGT